MMDIRFYRDICCLFFFFSLLFLTISCTRKEEQEVPVEYTVCREKELPDALARMIEKKKEAPFSFTYEDGAHLYLAVGYGRQAGTEYAAAVCQVYETEKAIYVDTILLDSSYVGDRAAGTPADCPYLVLRCEKKEKPVFFL